MLIADLHDYLGEDGLLTDGPRRLLARHLAAIVQAGTVAPLERTMPSAVPCIRRPGRRLCKGHLHITRTSDIGGGGGTVEWQCPECDDEGFVTGWEGGPWDLGWMHEQTFSPDLHVALDDSQLEALRASETVAAELPGLVAGAVYLNGANLIAGSEEHTERLLDILAGELNGAALSSRRRRATEQAYEKVAAVLDEHRRKAGIRVTLH
jgi:hypothetical protein